MQNQHPEGTYAGLKRPECQITFPSRPFDPPSSPPPTSPLPPLPEIALYRHGPLKATSSPTHSLPKMSSPVRPPRPQTSLPDLKPRTITSPDSSQRQRLSQVRAQTRQFSISSGNWLRRPPNEPQGAQASGPLGFARLRTPSPISKGGSTFSDDVLQALPKLFTKLSPVHSPNDGILVSRGNSERFEPCHVYHSSPVKQSRLVAAASRRQPTRKPVARSALFIPNTPPGQASQIDLPDSALDKYSSPPDTSHNAVRNQLKASSVRDASDCGRASPTEQYRQARAFHKRSPALTAFNFGFEGHHASVLSMPSINSGENLTSLPRIPSDQTLLVDGIIDDKKTRSRSLFFSLWLECKGISESETTFAALPYAYALQFAGRETNAENHNDIRNPTGQSGIEPEQVEAEPLDEQGIRLAKRKKLLWVLATISLVVIATSGILMGIIWKLRSLE